jgi:hypothetical protein
LVRTKPQEKQRQSKSQEKLQTDVSLKPSNDCFGETDHSNYEQKSLEKSVAIQGILFRK